MGAISDVDATHEIRPELYNGLTRVQHMVERGGLTAVPETFIQPLHMRASARSINCELQIPVIDMGLLQRGEEGKKQVHAAITHACEQWGFFKVVNHAVPAELMDAVMDKAQKFFALSVEEKEVYSHRSSSDAVGYGRFFEAYHKDDEIKEWLDRLTVDLPSANDPTQSHNLVINNPPHFHDVYEEFGAAVNELGKRLMALLFEELGQAPDFLLSKFGGNEKMFMRTIFNYYPPCPQPELVMGSPPHSDSGVLTILQQGEVPGLQVLHNDVWVPVPPSSDHAFVVNMGDALQVVSNGRFKSTMHRAVVQSTASRISIANFMAPFVDVVMEPAAELCNEGSPAVYRSVTFGDLMKFLVSQAYGRSESRGVEGFRI